MHRPCRISRRRFLQGAGAAAAFPLFSLPAGAGDRPPNFVFILTDDQRYDTLSCAGHPFLHTPRLDRLARDGAFFENAFVTTALCSPSRASFLTGQYAHRHGVRDNNTPFPAEARTFPRILQEHGYRTAFIGKWHMGTQEGPQPGFDHWVSFPGQGVYRNPVLNINGETKRVPGYITDILTDLAVQWLRERSAGPFCLCLSHKAVHSDFIPAHRHSGLFTDAVIEPPASIHDTLEGKPEWLRQVKRAGPGAEYREMAELVRNYCRCLAAVDESVGRVMRTLQDGGVLDNTLVVFAGDNGFFFGEHGLSDKRAMYEEAIRIPLLMHFPALIRPGTRIREMALNIDLCPTLLDLAGLAIPGDVQGRSLRPLLAGRKIPWRDEFLYEYDWEPDARRRPAIRGVRTERWKYIEYPGSANISELYDLRSDPLELHNIVYFQPGTRIEAEMKERLGHLTQGIPAPRTGPAGA